MINYIIIYRVALQVFFEHKYTKWKGWVKTMNFALTREQILLKKAAQRLGWELDDLMVRTLEAMKTCCE